jgi:hypothetical protein
MLSNSSEVANQVLLEIIPARFLSTPSAIDLIFAKSELWEVAPE